MIDSLLSFMPQADITVLCLDPLTQTLLRQIFPQVRLLRVQDMETAFPDLLKAKTNRTATEYYWTLTPCLMEFLLLQAEPGEALVYLDADQYFFSSPQPILNQLQHVSVLIQPHAFPQRLEKKLIQFGKFNVGVVGARQTPEGIKVIRWWKERCIEWCHSHYEAPDRFGDQKYLDNFTEISPDVGIMRHPGVGVAPWNHDRAEISTDNAGQLIFGKVPLVVFHYHSFVIVADGIYIPAKHNEDYQISLTTVELCYVPYIKALEAALCKVQTIDASFALESTAREIEADAPLVIRAPLAEILDKDMPYKLASEVDGYRIFMPDLSPRQNVWQGNYASWEQASAASGNYDSAEILKKTLHTSRMARDGKIVCERDSVPLPQREYPLPTLSGLLLGAARNGGELHLIDFGGALGSTYRTCSPFLRQLKEIRWHVVELPSIVEIGKKEFQNQELHFHSSIEECMRHNRVDGILFGASLQYLPHPYKMLQELAAYNFDYIVIDRTSFSKEGGHRICVQNIPEHIYKASYPCHILDLNTCLEVIRHHYTIVDVTPSQEGTIGDIDFKGIIATRGSLQSQVSNAAESPAPAHLFQEKLEQWQADTTILRHVNLGCGSRYLPEWLNIDFAAHPPLVLGWNLTCGIPLPNTFVDAVYHSNLIEHFTPNDALAFLKECVRVLKPGGILRIAAPDLEGAVRSYLACLEGARSGDATWQARYDWAIIELIDQLVRHQSGGEMLRYWSMKNIPAEDYILERVGTEYISARKHILQQPPQKRTQRPRPLEVGAFRLGGEVHQWMYDTYSLKKLMSAAGVKDIAVCAYAESSIKGFSESILEKQPNGSVYKPDSIYLEGIVL